MKTYQFAMNYSNEMQNPQLGFLVSEPCLLHLQEELVSMKQRIRVVVVDNEKLQGELKSKMVEETLKDYTLLDATVQYNAVS